MSKNPFATALVTLITITFVMSSTFLIAPQKAHATIPVANIPGIIADALNLSEATINAISNVASQVANWAQWVNTYILQPIAFVKSGNLMKALTAGVIKFAVGTTNGTGAPQFVRNLQGNLQGVGDARSLTFVAQYKSNSNSPFASSISSALRKNYLQNSSLSGFFSANKSTLPSNINGFLKGNWSNGGVSSWFALTTQDKNNPYMLYQSAQSKMDSLVTNATAARLSELTWGSGMLSWCGATEGKTVDSGLENGAECKVSSDCKSNNCGLDAGGWTAGSATGGSCYTSTDCDTGYSCTSGTCTQDNVSPGTTGTEGAAVCMAYPVANSGDPCVDKDGTPGTIKTPGSVIKESLTKVLGGNQDKLTQVGRMASEIGGIMNSIASVWNTVTYAKSILGGSGGDDGLFGFGTTRMTSSGNSSAYSGATSSTTGTSEVYTSVATSDVLTSTMLSRIDKYKTAWETIKGSADTASTSVLDLITACTASITAANKVTHQTTTITTFITNATTQKTSAQTVLDGAIKTVFDNFETASTTWHAASTTVANIKATLTAGKDASTDIASLTTMSPTSADLKTAMYDATTFDYSSDYSFTSASPDGSLTVSGSSIVDQMALISTNAGKLKKSKCTWPQTSSTSSN